MSVTNPQEDCHQRRENADHRIVTKLIDCENGEMSHHAWCDRVSATTRRPHCRYKLRVNEKYFARVLQVVPMLMIEELAQQLYWRLSSIYLSGRHVHVVDKNDRLLVRWRSKISFLSTVHLCHYQRLNQIKSNQIKFIFQ